MTKLRIAATMWDAANVNVDEVKKEVYKLLTSDKVTDKPLNDKAACAIMAVIQAESEFKLGKLKSRRQDMG